MTILRTKKIIFQIENNIAEVLESKTPLAHDLWQILLKQHPADIALLLDRLEHQDQVTMMQKLPEELAVDVFQKLEEPRQEAILESLEIHQATYILQNMPADEVTDLLENLSDEKVKRYLDLLQKEQRKRVISLLNFDPQSAGGIMDSDVITLTQDLTIRKSIAILQKVKPQREYLHRLYVTDRKNFILGYINVDELITNKPDTPLHDILHKNELVIKVNEDQESVAKQMSHYDLLIAPVVDDRNYFLGVITADDIFSVFEKEASEDVYKISGIAPIEHRYFQTPFWKLIWQRSPWLVSLLLFQSISGFIVTHYSMIIDKYLILASFLTMLIGTGGNAGNQSGALVIRGLAVGEIRRRNSLKVLGREFKVSLVMAFILGIIGFLRVYMLTEAGMLISIAINLSLVLIIITSMLLGSLIPIVLERLNFDPAHSAQPFLSTLMDIIGILIYLTVSTKLLS